MAWRKSKYKELGDNYFDYLSEYKIWRNMHERCEKKSSPMYKHYGNRGISVCSRWSGEKGFINFYNDMGARPIGEDGRAFQIDRIDNDGNYEPSNCRWAHPRDNARNRSDTIKIALYGDEYVLQDICDMFGLKRTTISEAIRLGRRSKEEALEFAFIRKFRRAR